MMHEGFQERGKCTEPGDNFGAVAVVGVSHAYSATEGANEGQPYHERYFRSKQGGPRSGELHWGSKDPKEKDGGVAERAVAAEVRRSRRGGGGKVMMKDDGNVTNVNKGPIWTEGCAQAHGPSTAGSACARRRMWSGVVAEKGDLIYHGSPLIRGELIDQNTVYACNFGGPRLHVRLDRLGDELAEYVPGQWPHTLYGEFYGDGNSDGIGKLV
ncbi:hypothetical protein K438DRAFT_1946862 [Mycena galopus ATCC 62051]|nr:hypothetical protein K438DRAFT_1946862 [Mycena galopus ATCC 62051]